MANSSLLDLYNVGRSREPVGGDYPKPGQDLIDRMTMLPIGQYEDGSLTLAWPGMVNPAVEMGRGQFQDGANEDLMTGMPQLQALYGAASDPFGTAKNLASSAYDFLVKPAYEGAVRSFEEGRKLPRVDSEGYYAGTPRAEPLDAFNAASIAPMGTVGLRATGLTKDVGDLGMFAGRGAKTADHAKLAEAERLASQGAPREQIWNDTGWFQGVDGKWRFEIDDRSASFSPTTGSFGDALNHPGLLDAYPDIMRYPTAVSADTQHLGSFHPHKREFMVTAEGGRSSALHEGQHAIQQIEDFAAGGNLLTGASPGNDHIRRGSTMMLEAITEGAFGARPQRPLLPWQRDEWSKGVARIEAADLKYSEGKRIAEEGRRLNQAPLPTLDQMLRNYRNLAGETEARAVEKRLEYSPDERTARPPWLDYDVPEGDQVVRFNANDSNAAAPSLALNAMEKPQGIRAYHGSPHDFDKFSMDKIGAGEGAQAYGHGLYFAENEGTAKWYRERLAPSRGWGVDDGPVPHVNDRPVSFEELPAYGHFRRNGHDIEKAIVAAQKSVETSERESNRFAFTKTARDTRKHWRSYHDENKSALDLLKQWRDQGVQIGERTLDHDGRMYEVNINADPNKFLDWDTMPAKQQARLRTPDGAAEMRAQGVPGIRYLDATSRAAGAGTHNYVVFDDSLIDIMRKYANPETAAAPSLLLNSEDGQQNPLLANAGPDTSGYGLRPDGTEKGAGYFGELPRPDGGVSTELSMGVGIDGRETEIPLLVPSLDGNEVNWLLSNEPDPGSIPEPIVQKAYEHALSRISSGQNPFAQNSDLRLPPMTVPSHSMFGPTDISTSDILRRYGLLSN